MTLKELERFFKLCKKSGVESIKFEGTEVFFNPQLPSHRGTAKNAPQPILVSPGGISAETRIPQPTPMPDVIDTDEMTEEQKLFGSADPSVWQSSN